MSQGRLHRMLTNNQFWGKSDQWYQRQGEDVCRLKRLSFKYEDGGCCISFDSLAFKELSCSYEKSWKSAAILLFAKIMYTLLHRQIFWHCYDVLGIL